MTSSPARPRSPLALVVAVLAGVGHLVVGYFYVAGGLVIPGYVLFPMWALWVVLAGWLILLAARRPWWTPAVPATAAVVFVVVLVVGGMLGWQA